MMARMSKAGVVVGMAFVMALFVACGGGEAADTRVADGPPMQMAPGTPMGESAEEHADHGLVAVTEDDGQTIRYWTCVMHPSRCQSRALVRCAAWT